jgi:methenyltetrahydrofolate cyclohydrolase
MEHMSPYLDELASSAPVPGGGSAAAVAAAMGAALLAMVCNLTLGKKRYADVQERTARARDEALALLTRARELAGEDAEAYARVSAALALPRETEDEQVERRSAVQDALKGAAFPPLETMRVASEIARQAAELVQFGNRSAITDVGSASLLADSAYRAARLNVDVNLQAIRDNDWKGDFQHRITEFRDPGDWNAAVQAEVTRVLEAE